MSGRERDLVRIDDALQAAAAVLRRHAAKKVEYEVVDGWKLLTAADGEVDDLLRDLLPRDGEGWLSEETADDARRLSCRRVWIVDPLDGTRDFIAGRPEYSVSIALVEDGVPVLGGICNPASGVTVLGGKGPGVEVRGELGLSWPAGDGPRALASRREVQRGEWAGFAARGVRVLPMGSVAYKLALVAAGFADATWTLWPKHEWDVAAGFALVRAAGGMAVAWGNPGRRFNRARATLAGAVAAVDIAAERVVRLLEG